jgi:two-component system, NarL family, nitrate/nitrite response regulator NarL
VFVPIPSREYREGSVMQVSVAVVDDHPLLLEGVASLIRKDDRFRLAATGAAAKDIPHIAATHRPDAMTVDLNLPGDAFRAIAEAAKIAPAMKMIVFTASTEADQALKALDAGARGYVLKGSPAADLFAAIEAAQRGEVYITPSFAAQVINQFQASALRKAAVDKARLNAREDQIVRLLACGKRNSEIARALSLSERTVKSYMTNLMHKLNARNRLEVVLTAQQMDPALMDAARASTRVAELA